MPQTLTDDQILERLTECLVPALGITPEEVVLDASLVDDLGAESIDMVDILFQIRKTFQLDVNFDELQSALYGDLTEAEFFDQNRQVTPEGMAQLGRLLPDFDPARYNGSLSERQLYGLFRVRHLVALIGERLKQTSEVDG